MTESKSKPNNKDTGDDSLYLSDSIKNGFRDRKPFFMNLMRFFGLRMKKQILLIFAQAGQHSLIAALAIGEALIDTADRC